MATKKLLAQLSCLALVGTVALAGCSGSDDATTAEATSNPSALQGDLNIVVSSATGSDAGFKKVNEAFGKKYPNVKVNFTAVPNENYNASKSSRLTAGSADIVIANPKELPSYVPADNAGDDARLADAGGFVDLSGEEFMKNFTPTVLDQTKYKGKNYTVPTGLSYYSGMMYNKKIFTDNGIAVPTTWSEFTKVCDTLKAKGITPLGIGGKDSAGLNMLALVQTTYPTAQDKQDLAKGLYENTVKLNEGKQLEVMQKLQTLYGYAQPNFAGVSYATMTSDFVKGKYAMMSDGTWNTATLTQAGGKDFQFGYFPLPASDTAADNKFLGGKVELSLGVPANTKNKAAALAWLDTFSQKENYQLFLDEAGFAPAEPGIEAGEFYKGVEPYMTTFEPAWDTIWIVNQKAGAAAQRPFNWEGLAPMGKLDAKGAADAAQKDWEAGK